jgi:hypothetical protein
MKNYRVSNFFYWLADDVFPNLADWAMNIADNTWKDPKPKEKA